MAAGALAISPIAAGADTGGWTLATSPNPGSEDNSLSAVACPSATECWAVGTTNDTDSPSQALIERWDGTSWSNDTTAHDINPAEGTQLNQLSAVSCGSTGDCWAVGEYRPVDFDLPMAEHWNGSAWAASALPQFSGDPDGDYYLAGLSCPDTSDCLAVGYWDPDGGNDLYVLIDQWTTGGGWQILTTDDGTLGYLNGISCLDADDCYAVGQSDAASPNTNLIESWDGSDWGALPSIPNEGSGSESNSLNGISCVSTSYCWAVGSYDAGSGVNQNLFMQLSNRAWTIPADTSATDYNLPSENSDLLEGVACTSESSCWAVGLWGLEPGANTGGTLVDSWDGTSWALVANTANGGDTSEDYNELNGVACGDSGHCAAVGDYGENDPTLILMYVAPSAPVPASGSAAGGSALGLALLGAGLVVLLGSGGAAVLERRRLARR